MAGRCGAAGCRPRRTRHQLPGGGRKRKSSCVPVRLQAGCLCLTAARRLPPQHCLWPHVHPAATMQGTLVRSVRLENTSGANKQYSQCVWELPDGRFLYKASWGSIGAKGALRRALHCPVTAARRFCIPPPSKTSTRLRSTRLRRQKPRITTGQAATSTTTRHWKAPRRT